jgi:hypothetical protein
MQGLDMKMHIYKYILGFVEEYICHRTMVNVAYRIFLGVYTNWTYYLMAYIGDI